MNQYKSNHTVGCSLFCLWKITTDDIVFPKYAVENPYKLGLGLCF